MASRRRRSADERTIADAWRAAKRADPSLTQRQFAAESFPAYVERHGKPRFRKVATRERDLRRILSGKDTRARVRPLAVQARDFVRAARRPGQPIEGVNVAVVDRRGRVVGFGNIALAPGMSIFDAHRLRDSEAGKRLARQIARAVRRNSPPHNVTEFRDPLTGRKVYARVIDSEIGSPAADPRIMVIRQLRDPDSNPDSYRYAGKFGFGD
jgi:hypothetical protein